MTDTILDDFRLNGVVAPLRGEKTDLPMDEVKTIEATNKVFFNVNSHLEHMILMPSDELPDGEFFEEFLEGIINKSVKWILKHESTEPGPLSSDMQVAAARSVFE